MARCVPERNVLYHNNGDGTFTDVTAKAGLRGNGWSGDVAVFDFDDDGYLDLLVTSIIGGTKLYRNNKDGTFTDVTKVVLGRTSFGAVAARAFDFNNDGKLDLFVVDMYSDMWLPTSSKPRDRPPGDLKKKYPRLMGPFHKGNEPLEKACVDALNIRYEDVVFGNTLFQRLPNGKFVEVSDKANMETWWPWGIATGDFDNDGFEDVFLPSGRGYPHAYWPNALMMNNGDGTFTDRAGNAGIEPPRGGEYLKEKIDDKPAARSSRSAAVADFDHSGRLSVVVNNFNDVPYYFRNNFRQEKLDRLPLGGHEEQPGCDRCPGHAPHWQRGHGAASASGWGIPVAIVQDRPLWAG